LKSIKSYFSRTNRILYPLAALIALVVADGLITRFLVRQGLGQEVNPFIKALAGETHFVVIKVLGALLCALILWDIYRRRPKLALISSWCFAVAYAGIVLWNLGIFFISQV
jgi:hypothetical protein